MESGRSSSRFSKAVTKLLEDAGWHQGRDAFRKLNLPSSFELFPAAEQVLREFGGLKAGNWGPGIECAASEVEIDPALEVGIEQDLAPFEKDLKTKLYPLGDVDRGHGILVIDQIGRVYLLTDDLELLADSFDRGLEILLLGLQPDGPRG